MTIVPHRSPWFTAIYGEPFDPAWASASLVRGATPWDVASEYMNEKGRFCRALLQWLRDQGCAPPDIGRFARQMGIPAEEFLALRKGHPDGVEMTKGFVQEHPPRPAATRSPDFGNRSRTLILVNDPESRRLAYFAWRAIKEANDPPQLFAFGGLPAWVLAHGEDPPMVQPLSKDGFSKYVHHRTIRWAVPTRTGYVEVEPEHRVIADMLADPHPPLPGLVGVRVAPVFGPSGKLAMDSGYHPDSRMFIWMNDLHIPFIPSRPTRADISKARHLIEFELFGDFPFEDDASRAHAIAALLHPFVRPMISGATPLHLVDKPVAGTGAGLLVEALTLPGLGTSPTITTVGKLEDERQFRMVALLRSGPIAVLLDNINKKFDSETFAAMITAPDTYSGRIIRSSDIVVIPIRCLWLATGNNVQVSHEMARRCVLIRMDAGLEHPEEGRVFRHDRLMDWAREHRGELVWAALVLVQSWVAEGMPRGSKTKGTFESWAETIGGIFEVCGIPGFLDNTDKMKAFSDPEADAWTALVEEWWDRYQDQEVGSSDLSGFAAKHMTGQVGEGRSSATSWGIALTSKRDAVIAGKKIVLARKYQGASRWRLMPLGKK